MPIDSWEEKSSTFFALESLSVAVTRMDGPIPRPRQKRFDLNNNLDKVSQGKNSLHDFAFRFTPERWDTTGRPR